MKSRFFGVIPGHILQEEIRSDNRMDTTNASLDSFWLNEGQKIDPEWNEFTDFEKSWLAARGKPSTIVYRAGWLVEPSSFLEYVSMSKICTTYATIMNNCASTLCKLSFLSSKIHKTSKISGQKFDFFDNSRAWPRTCIKSPGYFPNAPEAS